MAMIIQNLNEGKIKEIEVENIDKNNQNK